MSAGEVLQEILAHPGFKDSVSHVHHIPAQEATFGDWPSNLAEPLRKALVARGIARPYTHQARAIELALSGKSTVIVTPTASGKSLCYNVPVVQTILTDPNARALYLFPTKALSHDQYHELYELTRACDADIRVYTYDGDTPPATRRALRDSGHLVVTNPDMLHSGILPHHTTWIRLFENLRYVIVDELHQYRGIFGSHVANVLARLRRLARFYGADPVFLCSSATIANPGELARELTGAEVELVTESGAPVGQKTFVVFNPPVVNKELNVRRSVRLEARRIALRFTARNHQVIVFGRSRLDVEVMTTYLKRGMTLLHQDAATITGYRGGYLPTERRAIEKGLKNRELLGVVSTNALELGIDIGGLDVSILAGFPGSISSLWQQAGRSGRKATDSVAFYIAGSSPLDQFLVNHPEYLFGRSPEEALINPTNLSIYTSHLRCAAFELPLEDGETLCGTNPGPILQYLEDEGTLRHVGERWHYSSDIFPGEDVSLRSAAGENFIVLDTGQDNKVIAEVDYDSAPFLIHDDAVYIHNGKTHLVEKLDWDRRTAFVRHRVLDYYTDAQASFSLRVIQLDEEFPEEKSKIVARKCLGEVNVSTIIARFKKVKFESQESIGYGVVSLPPLEMQTEAAWLVFRKELAPELKSQGLDFGEGLRALGHVMAQAIPLRLLCDHRDIQMQTSVRSTFDVDPAIYVWDRYPGGIGLARRFHVVAGEMLGDVRRIVSECPCSAGCPACIGPQLDNNPIAKRSLLALLAMESLTR